MIEIIAYSVFGALFASWLLIVLLLALRQVKLDSQLKSQDDFNR